MISEEEINRLVPGSATDQLVASELLSWQKGKSAIDGTEGWRWQAPPLEGAAFENWDQRHKRPVGATPRFTTDIQHAWRLFEALVHELPTLSLQRGITGWAVVDIADASKTVLVDDVGAPMAICRAALLLKRKLAFESLLTGPWTI